MPNDQLLTQPLFPLSFEEDFDFFGSVLLAGDFNGDGVGDLAIGTPDEDIDDITDSGRVSTIYGSFLSGLDPSDTQVIDQEFLGLTTSDLFDAFGASLAVGDFDGDGFDDLATGVIGQDVFSFSDNAGAVDVAYGSFFGLDDLFSQSLTAEDVGFSSDSEQDDLFGSTLASADFNGDGFDDLAIGVPNQDFDFGFTTDGGEVAILTGSFNGLTNSGGAVFSQVDPESFARFGDSLTTGDYNGDGFSDLVIGSPGRTVSGEIGAGGVNALFGSFSGLTATTEQIFSQDTPSILGIAETGDAFGDSLATGDFNADGFDDLVVGVALEDVGFDTDAGLVNVINGSRFGLTTAGNQTIEQDDLFGDSSESFDTFGASLAVGDFDGDGFDDLAVGAPGENVGGVVDAGAVNVIYGSFAGLQATVTSSQFWTQDTVGVLDFAEDFDRFGSSLTAHDFDGDGFDDLAIGVPGEDVGFAQDTGAVHILHGSFGGLVA